MRIARLSLLVALVASISAAPSHTPAASLEGVFEYTGALRGQSIVMNGRFTFLFGAAGGGPMISHAGSYRIRGDTVRGTILFSTEPNAVGKSLRWTVTSWSADTATYVIFDPEGQENGRARVVRIQ